MRNFCQFFRVETKLRTRVSCHGPSRGERAADADVYEVIDEL